MPEDQKIQFTLALIKSKAIEDGHADNIRHAMAQMPGITVVAEIYAALKGYEAFATLYEEHQGRAYYDGLLDSVRFPHTAQVFVLRGPEAITRWRKACGATDPRKAAEGTLRAKYGHDMPHNAVHGSDSPESAVREIRIFFPQLDLSEMGMTPPAPVEPAPQPDVKSQDPVTDMTFDATNDTWIAPLAATAAE